MSDRLAQAAESADHRAVINLAIGLAVVLVLSIIFAWSTGLTPSVVAAGLHDVASGA